MNRKKHMIGSQIQGQLEICWRVMLPFDDVSRIRNHDHTKGEVGSVPPSTLIELLKYLITRSLTNRAYSGSDENGIQSSLYHFDLTLQHL
ncbi:hypothetical protein TNCV_1563731 [Trichonephila clavipes]|nr:hypothetical protein TNCV_1563731 [Trichonephila clavipes]